MKFCSRVPVQCVDGVPLLHPGCLSVVWDAVVAYALLGMPHIVTYPMASGSRTPKILTLCERQRAFLGYPSLMWRNHCFGTPTPLRHHPSAEYATVCGCSVAEGRVPWDRLPWGQRCWEGGCGQPRLSTGCLSVSGCLAPAVRWCQATRHGSLSGPGWVPGRALSLSAVP